MKRFKKALFLATIGLVLTCSQTAQAALYRADQVHSTIGFTVKHLMVSEVKGEFTDYQTLINFDSNDLKSSNVDVTIQVSSINTRNEKRDKHLKTSEFFDADNHPTITFKSTDITKTDNGYTISGDLTIRGVTKAISIPCAINGPVKNPMGEGEDVIGINGKATINRQDFGVSWNKEMDQGGYVVGNDVTIDVELEAHVQKEIKEE